MDKDSKVHIDNLSGIDYNVVVRDYLEVLDFTYLVVNSLKGKRVDGRLADIEQLAFKIFAHATSIYWLQEGTKANLKSVPNGVVSFFDAASIAVIARAVLDTYFVMYEVFFEHEDNDLFEFNYVLWQLAGLQLRERHEDVDASLVEQYARAQKEIAALRNRLQSTTKFATLTLKQQAQVLAGNRDVVKANKELLAQQIGFGPKTLKLIFSYQSSFVHSDGLSGAQLYDARSKDEQLELIRVHMDLVLIILSKMIIEYARKFPEAKAICDRHKDLFQAVSGLSDVARGYR